VKFLKKDEDAAAELQQRGKKSSEKDATDVWLQERKTGILRAGKQEGQRKDEATKGKFYLQDET